MGVEAQQVAAKMKRTRRRAPEEAPSHTTTGGKGGRVLMAATVLASE